MTEKERQELAESFLETKMDPLAPRQRVLICLDIATGRLSQTEILKEYGISYNQLQGLRQTKDFRDLLNYFIGSFLEQAQLSLRALAPEAVRTLARVLAAESSNKVEEIDSLTGKVSRRRLVDPNLLRVMVDAANTTLDRVQGLEQRSIQQVDGYTHEDVSRYINSCVGRVRSVLEQLDLPREKVDKAMEMIFSFQEPPPPINGADGPAQIEDASVIDDPS
jgi:hypothetical protein